MGIKSKYHINFDNYYYTLELLFFDVLYISYVDVIDVVHVGVCKFSVMFWVGIFCPFFSNFERRRLVLENNGKY